MKSFFRKNIAPLIALTVLITVSIQVYWNAQNYQNNKQEIINTIQIALDNSINNYYSDKAKSDLSRHKYSSREPIIIGKQVQHPIKSNKITIYRTGTKSDTLRLDSPEDRKVIFSNFSNKKDISIPDIQKIQDLADRIIIAVRGDSIDLNKLAKYLDNEFASKQLNFEYGILYKRDKKTIAQYHKPNDKKFLFSTQSKSSYLPENSELKLFFPDIFLKTLKKGLTGIALSFLFSLSVIICLFYLLSVIRQQKQLAIIKNDFISNISHELKTPIAVVSSALEGIEKFNADNEPEKTKKYMAISREHLSKLNEIVEKILETSALESDKLQLHKSDTEIIHLINHTIEKLKINTDKTILLNTSKLEIVANVDSFHFENVISNLIDNATKYGGDAITITINEDDNNIFVEISDNGMPIEKTHRQKIFEKFYRIPQNNLHNEKGFGIGLYYAKNIITKHGGTLELISEGETTFKISVPNE